jgi:hypothetical protein
LNKIITKLHDNWPTYRVFAMALLISTTVAWTIHDWAYFRLIKEKADEVVAIGASLVVTELCFILGALLMAASLGINAFGGARGSRAIARHVKHVRSQVKTIIMQTGQSRLFGVGFWLNFFGAVGTSFLLVLATFYYIPVAGWWLLGFLIIDVIATFGLRIPVHLARKKIKKANQITVRRAVPADIGKYIELQSERWDADVVASRAQLESRLKHYPQGMLVAERGGQIVGMVYAMRISEYDYERCPSWDEITNKGFCNNVDLNGNAIFGVDLSTAKGVGSAAGDKLLLGIGELAIKEGVKEILLGGRMPEYHKYADKMSPEDYLRARGPDNKPLDHQIKFYTSVPGLKALKVLPDYFQDPDSLNYGVLLRWHNPFYGLPGKKAFIRLLPLIERI